MSEEKVGSIAEKAGKYLTFQLAGEEYGLEIIRVKEIIGMMDITALPRTPGFVKGVINLRGKVITVIDLRLKFDLVETEHTDKTCIIVVETYDGNQIGVIVDSVSEVLNVVVEDLEETPSFGVSLDTEFILGMAKSEGKVRTLLNIDKVLSAQEISMIA